MRKGVVSLPHGWGHDDPEVPGREVDQLATGPKLRILTVVDTFSRFSPAVVPRFRFRAPDVVEVLEQVCAQVGYGIMHGQ